MLMQCLRINVIMSINEFINKSIIKRHSVGFAVHTLVVTTLYTALILLHVVCVYHLLSQVAFLVGSNADCH